MMKNRIFAFFLIATGGLFCTCENSSEEQKNPGNNPGQNPGENLFSPAILTTPQNQATDVSVHPSFAWEKADDNDNDGIVYTIYIGTDRNEIDTEKTNLDQITYEKKGLRSDTQYFWQIIATNKNGENASSEIFEFRTKTCSEADKSTLEAIYDATNGDGWMQNTNWKSTESLGAWTGVTVNQQGCVTQLDLINNNLIGSFPTEIAGLSELTNLSLSSNQLTDSIPKEISNLTNLESLQLDGNQLTGEIPAEIGSMTTLNDLRLYNNRIAGMIPTEIGNLERMVTLNLQQNQLEGPIPTEIGNLILLEDINFSENNLTGSIPFSIGRLTPLIALRLQNNMLIGSIPMEMSTLVNLTAFLLSNNQLTGDIPDILGQITGLQILRLENNANLTGPLPGNWCSITNQDIRGTQINPCPVVTQIGRE